MAVQTWTDQQRARSRDHGRPRQREKVQGAREYQRTRQVQEQVQEPIPWGRTSPRKRAGKLTNCKFGKRFRGAKFANPAKGMHPHTS